MLNLSDKELDRLSREAAEQYEPDEEISSWEKLEQRLSREIEDKPPATPTRFRVRPLGYGALLLLLVGTSYFLLKSGNDSKSSTLKSKVSTETNKPAGDKPNSPAQNNSAENRQSNPDNKKVDNKNESPSANGASNAANDATSSSVKAENAPGKTQENAGADNNSVAGANDKSNAKSVNSGLKDSEKSGNNQNNTVTKNKTIDKAGKNRNGRDLLGGGVAAGVVTAGNKNNQNLSGNKKKGSQNLQKENATDIADAGYSPLLQSESEKSSGKNKIAGDDATDKPKYAALPDIAFSGISANGISDSSLLKTAAIADNNPPVRKNQSLHINRSLKIGLMVAPDMTLVHSTSSGSFSTNFGLTLGYQFFKGWSINSGIIYTKKDYASKGKDFHPKWVNYNPDGIELVTGNCDMWEIPLSIRYDFPSANKINFFVNAGLSSYLMKSESYDVYYRGGYPGSGPRPIPKTNSNEKYWFSIGTISAGIEHQFSKNFSLQAEPFVKIPFSGVGLGNLQLNSYGVAFSLRYSPVLSKSRH